MTLGAGAVRHEPGLAVWLDQVSEQELVGGKAWNLSRMVNLGLPVPRGFVLTDAAFQSFLEENDLHREIPVLCTSADPSEPGALCELSRRIRERVLKARLPRGVRAALSEGYRNLAGEGRRLIVRSSAVGEDSGGSSFAGQLDSFPDIASETEAERAVLACWASCWSDRSLHYQSSRGVSITRMGVVVQEQVTARAAGVLFTVSPEAGGEEAMLGEYCLGHGDGLVSGRINPGRFTVSREGFRCELLAEPEQPEAEGTYRLESAPIQTLQRAGLLLEQAFGAPQDIEWALDHEGKVHLVQARPVTTPRTAGKKPGRSVLWSNANINENYPDPASPFLYSIASDGYYHYFRNLAFAFGIAPRRIEAMEPALRGIIGAHCSRLYYNLSNIHAALRMAPFGEELVSSFNLFVGAAEVAEAAGEGGAGRVSRLAELAVIAARTSWCFFNLERGVVRFEARVDDFAARRHPQRLERAGLVELNAALREFLDIRCRRWTDAALADAASMIGYGLLKRLLAQDFPGDGGSVLHNTLLQGLPGMVSALPSSELWELSRTVRESATLRELFREAEDEIWSRLAGDSRYATFRDALERYLERWGFRRSGELMLTVPSFQEEPRGVLALLKNYLALEGDSPETALLRQEQERERETGRVLRELRGRKLLPLLPWPTRATLVSRVLRATQRAVMLRERARLKQSLLYGRLRRVMLEMGARLSEGGYLAERDDVFFLTCREIDELVTGRAMYASAVRDLVAVRKREQARHAGMAPPEAMTLPEGEYYDPEEGAPPEAGGATGDALSGTGACGGKVTARATVLADVAESGRLAAGDVLVTRQTDPGWAPVFFLVSGLVMERGGMLSHGAIVAREFGIPTVVGVRDATKRVPSGTTVTVDGDAGCVRLVG